MDRLSGAVFEISKRLCQNSILVQPPHARELYYIIYPLPFVFFLGRESFSSGAVFLSNRLRKDFERFVCKEKRRTFVTAKAIPARLIEELFRRARRDSFLGGGSGDELFLERQP